VACSNVRRWKLNIKNEETRLGALEMKGLRKILRVSWTAKKTNEWVLNKAGVKRELLDTVKARKLACYGHTIRKQGSCLEKKKMQGTTPGARRRGRPRTAWMDNIKTWKSQSEWDRTEINGESTSMVSPTLRSRTAKQQNRIDILCIPKTSTFLFFKWLCQKLTDFDNFWCVKSWENLTWTRYRFVHLTCHI